MLLQGAQLDHVSDLGSKEVSEGRGYFSVLQIELGLSEAAGVGRSSVWPIRRGNEGCATLQRRTLMYLKWAGLSLLLPLGLSSSLSLCSVSLSISSSLFLFSQSISCLSYFSSSLSLFLLVALLFHPS